MLVAHNDQILAEDGADSIFKAGCAQLGKGADIVAKQTSRLLEHVERIAIARVDCLLCRHLFFRGVWRAGQVVRPNLDGGHLPRLDLTNERVFDEVRKRVVAAHIVQKRTVHIQHDEVVIRLIERAQVKGNVARGGSGRVCRVSERLELGPVAHHAHRHEEQKDAKDQQGRADPNQVLFGEEDDADYGKDEAEDDGGPRDALLDDGSAQSVLWDDILLVADWKAAELRCFAWQGRDSKVRSSASRSLLQWWNEKGARVGILCDPRMTT